jgi:hypothetical protein
MGVWEDMGETAVSRERSAYSCGCDPGMRREHKNIGYQCKFDREGFVEKVTQSASEPTQSAYGCGCDPGYRKLNKNIGYLCENYPNCTYGKAMYLARHNLMVVQPNTLTDAEWRKQRPLVTGCLDYFPDALLEVAYCSWVGNEQHNPGQPLHWDRSKSQDEPDALMRHLKDRGTLDSDNVRHSAKAAWRSLALLQKEIEAERSK